MFLILHGRTPSKKNSRKIFTVRGRIVIAPSSDYAKWHKDASLQLKKFSKEVKQNSSITMVFFAGDNRKFDLSNKCESVMDLLVDNGFLPDDSWEYCKDIHLMFGGVDKNNPRVTIEII